MKLTQRCIILTLGCVLAGCATDEIDVPGLSTSGFADDDGTGAADEGPADDDAGDDAADDTTGEPPELQAFGDCVSLDPLDVSAELDPEVTFVEENEVSFPAGVVCPELGFVSEIIDVVVTRPDPMPEAALPIVVFIAGVGQQSTGYDHIHDVLAERGFLVLNVTNDTGQTDVDWRKDRLACALRWLRWEPDSMGPYSGNARPSAIDPEHISCAVATGGHSNGGGAAFEVVAERFTQYATQWEGYEAVAVFAIAPRAPGVPGPPGGAVPLLAIATEHENEVPGGAQIMFDLMAGEDDPNAPGRYLLSTHAVGHHGFGSGGFLGLSALGGAIATEYIAAFLSWRVLDQNPAEARAFLTTRSFPESVLDPSYCANEEIYTNADFSGGVDCTEILDPGECADTRGCVVRQDDSCVGRPLILSSYYLDEVHLEEERSMIRTFEADVLAAEEQSHPMVAAGPTVAIADIAVLLDPVTTFTDGALPGHTTDLALIEWGGALQGVDGTVTIDLGGADLRNFTHASMRIAQASGMVFTSENECTTTRTSPIDLDLSIVDADGNGPVVAMDPLITQGAAPDSQDRCDGGGLDVDCCVSQFLHTQTFALADFCAQGPFSIDEVDSLVLHLPEETEDAHVILDTVEFTYSPFDEPAPGTEGPGQEFMFACEIDELAISETSCAGEPLQGVCDGPDVVVTPVDPPEVDTGVGTFDGWAVHVPAGWVRDPQSLTGPEYDAVISLCAQACELEWSDWPHVAPNDCADEDAFLAPVAISETSHRSHRRIPADYADGSDLFTGESLTCDLRTDCCEEFSEDICAARLDRATEAGQPLGRGEAWVLDVAGVTWADSSFADAPVTASMTGSIGYTFCAEGDGTSCPFYLGSLELELSEPLELELECNGVPQVHELESLEIRLAQPAFGVAQHGSSWKAFPPGSVMLDASGVVDAIPFASRRPIEQPVYFQAGEDWMQLQGTGGAFLEFGIPCNGAVADVKVAWAFENAATAEAPPTVSIASMSSTVSCPDTLPLQLTSGADPDDDLVSLRWLVDGVLLEDSTTSIPFTESHEITAILRDARGATATATKTISCE